MTKCWITLAVLGLLAARGTKPAGVARPVDPDAGFVAIYLKPFSPAAGGLKIRLDGVSAVREDGTLIPLTLALKELGGDGTTRQRLLAWGSVPSGAYAGFSITVAAATVVSDGVTRSLPPNKDPSVAAISFRTGPARSALVAFELDAASSLGSDEEAFSPVFGPSVPSKLATGLIGVVSSAATGQLTVFDKISGQVAGVVPVGRGASEMAVDAQRNRLHVVLTDEDALATVDLLEGTVLTIARLRGGDQPVSVALTPDGKTLLCANAGSSTVTLFDAGGPTLEERTRVVVGSGPRYVLMDRTGSRAWVFNSLGDTVTVLGVPSGLILGTVTSGGGPIRGQLGRNGDRLYVIHRSSPYVDVVDTSTLTVAQRVYVGPGAAALKVDAQTNRVYLGFKDASRVEVYDATALLPTDSILCDAPPAYLTIDGEGNNLCIVLPRKGEVRLVRLVGKTLAARLDVPQPSEVALLGER